MLDQNITTILLSTVLGGALSILASLVATHQVQSATQKTDKQKAIRNMIELVYKEMKIIVKNGSELDGFFKRERKHAIEEAEERDPFADWDNIRNIENRLEGIKQEVKESLDEIEMLVTLYLSPLHNDFIEYKKEIDSLIKEEDPLKERFEKVSKQFQDSILSLLKKRGYRYF